MNSKLKRMLVWVLDPNFVWSLHFLMKQCDFPLGIPVFWHAESKINVCQSWDGLSIQSAMANVPKCLDKLYPFVMLQGLCVWRKDELIEVKRNPVFIHNNNSHLETCIILWGNFFRHFWMMLQLIMIQHSIVVKNNFQSSITAKLY